jgi:hypothetical protein
MKEYPSIPNASKAPRQECYCQVKYDGSSIRLCWSKKQGWHKFGTRHLMINESTELFGSAITLFKNKYADDLEKAFKHKDFRGIDQFLVFAEWFGTKSFAGWHEEGDPKDIVLFDVNPHKKGFLSPKQFLDYFGHLPVAEFVWYGNLGEQLIQKVHDSDFDFVDFRSKYPITTEVPEGIVCKGGRYPHSMWMTKIKSRHYKEEIKRRRPVDWERLLQEDFPDEM